MIFKGPFQQNHSDSTIENQTKITNKIKLPSHYNAIVIQLQTIQQKIKTIWNLYKPPLLNSVYSSVFHWKWDKYSKVSAKEDTAYVYTMNSRDQTMTLNDYSGTRQNILTFQDTSLF